MPYGMLALQARPRSLGSQLRTSALLVLNNFSGDAVETKLVTRTCITHYSIAPLFEKGANTRGLGCVLQPAPAGAGRKAHLHTPKGVTYHEQPHYCRSMIGHSLGRTESWICK